MGFDNFMPVHAFAVYINVRFNKSQKSEIAV